jgi:hypothetical protein
VDPGRLAGAFRALLEHTMTRALPGSEVCVTAARTPSGVEVTVRCHARPARVEGDPVGEPGTPDAPTDDVALSAGIGVALASAVARSYGGRLRLVDGEPPDVAVRIELPTAADSCAESEGGPSDGGQSDRGSAGRSRPTTAT